MLLDVKIRNIADISNKRKKNKKGTSLQFFHQVS